MRQWICYRDFRVEAIQGHMTPDKHLADSFSELTFTAKLSLTSSATDSRKLGYIDAANQDIIDEVISDCQVFAMKAITIGDAEGLAEAHTGWAFTQNGDDLEATQDGETFAL